MSDEGILVTILVAEDDSEDRILTKEALIVNNLANDLHFVEDGEELLDYLYHRGKYHDPASAPRPGLLLLDLNMPRKDGREALQEIKADPSLRSIPVIVLTTSDSEDDIRDCYDLGANSYITKPITFAGLIRAMRAVSQYWFGTAGLPSSGRRS